MTNIILDTPMKESENTQEISHKLSPFVPLPITYRVAEYESNNTTMIVGMFFYGGPDVEPIIINVIDNVFYDPDFIVDAILNRLYQQLEERGDTELSQAILKKYVRICVEERKQFTDQTKLEYTISKVQNVINVLFFFRTSEGTVIEESWIVYVPHVQSVSYVVEKIFENAEKFDNRWQETEEIDV